MADWKLLLSDPPDPTTGAPRDILGEWVDVWGLSVSWDLKGPATAQWKSYGDDPGALQAVETATDALIYRDDKLVFRGRLGPSSDVIDQDDHKVSWSAVDYRGLLDRRVVYGFLGTGLSFTNVEQTEIAWALIYSAQEFTSGWVVVPEQGNMGITEATTPTGRRRDRTYVAGKHIGEAITQLSEVIDGFDWEITPELEFKTWYPGRGTNRNWVADLGGSVRGVSRRLDTKDYATDSLGIGDNIKSYNNYVGDRGKGGRWDSSPSWTDVTVQNTLDEHTAAYQADASILRPTYSLDLRRGAWSPDDAWLGDTTRIVIYSGRLAVDTTSRISGIDIKVDDNGEEAVTLTYGRREVTLQDRLRVIEDGLMYVNSR